MSVKTQHGSCHCGKVRYEVDIDWSAESGKCNCSICTKTRNWSMIVKPEAFRLISGEDDLSDYQFGTNSTHHLFCRHCGVGSFGRGHLDVLGGAYYSVKLACLDDVEPAQLAAVSVRFMDGRHNNWFSPPAETRYL